MRLECVIRWTNISISTGYLKGNHEVKKGNEAGKFQLLFVSPGYLRNLEVRGLVGIVVGCLAFPLTASMCGVFQERVF